MQFIVCEYPIPSEIIQAEEAIIDCSKQKTYGKLREKIDKGIALYEHLLKSESICRLIDTNQRTHQANYKLLLRLQKKFREHETITSSVKARIDEIIDGVFCHHVPRIEIIQSLCRTYQEQLARLKAAAVAKTNTFREEIAVHKKIVHQGLPTTIIALIEQAKVIALQMKIFTDTFPDLGQKGYPEYQRISKLTAIQFYAEQFLPLIPGSKRTNLDFFVTEILAAKRATAEQTILFINLLDRQWELRYKRYQLFEIKSATEGFLVKAGISAIDLTLFYLCASSRVLAPETYAIANHALTTGTNLIVRILKLSQINLSEELFLRKFDYPALIAEKLLSPSMAEAITRLNDENRQLLRDINYLETETSFCNLAQGILNFKLPVPKTAHAIETIFGFFVRRKCAGLLGQLGDWVRFKWATHITKPDELPDLSPQPAPSEGSR